MDAMHKLKQGSDVLIIGAGPSGLVAAKYCLEKGYHVRIFEANFDTGGSFSNKQYNNAHLVSSKYLTAFSDFRWNIDKVWLYGCEHDWN